jgi:hypothetical protein
MLTDETGPEFAFGGPKTGGVNEYGLGELRSWKKKRPEIISGSESAGTIL